MKKYNPKAKCPKCGKGSITSNFHKSWWCGMYQYIGGGRGRGEYLSRHCVNCTYQWVEEPLDFKE